VRKRNGTNAMINEVLLFMGFFISISDGFSKSKEDAKPWKAHNHWFPWESAVFSNSGV
jgi:hypothetical protein